MHVSQPSTVLGSGRSGRSDGACSAVLAVLAVLVVLGVLGVLGLRRLQQGVVERWVTMDYVCTGVISPPPLPDGRRGGGEGGWSFNAEGSTSCGVFASL